MKKIIIAFLALFLAKATAFCQVLPKEPEKQQATVAKPIPAKKQQIESTFVLVQGGTFTMGCTSEQGNDCGSDEIPLHQVTISSFRIARYDVTQAQWQSIMGNNPSENKGCENCPVTNISWYNVQDFINKLNESTGNHYRLPSEAEWEYAARGGYHGKRYLYAGSNDINTVAWFSDNSEFKTHPIGQKKPNELGLYDMIGNVWQYCSNWYGSYSSEIETNPEGPSTGSTYSIRGGAWTISR